MTAFVILLLVGIAVYAGTRNRRSRPQRHAAPLVERVAFLERRVAELQAALEALRGTAPTPKPTPEPEPEPTRAPAPPPPAPQGTPAPTPPRPAAAPAPAHAPSFDWARTVSTADLMGAKALAFAGGIVTLL